MDEKKEIFTPEELENVKAYVELLKSIRARLLSEGYPVDEMRRKYYEEKGGIMPV